MAIYHFEVKVHSRDHRANALNAAAYRAGERIYDRTTGHTYNFTRKKEVVHSEILAPANAPEWVADRCRLWHEVETMEKYVNARVCREFVVALPIELMPEQNLVLLRDYITTHLTSLGMIVDFSVHNKEGNPHAHLLCTTRNITGAGFSKKKNRDWDKKELLLQWRKTWAETVNQHLAQASFGLETFIDHRTLKGQGIDRLPSIHVGRKTPSTEASFERKRAKNNYVQRVNAAKSIVANAGDMDAKRADLARMEAELLAAKSVLAQIAEGDSDVQSTKRNPEPSPGILSTAVQTKWCDVLGKAEFEARSAFIEAMRKSPYTVAKFNADCERMKDLPGGPCLRWWWYAYRDAITKYQRTVDGALQAMPLHIAGWFRQCLDTFGEIGTWELFSTEERAQAARAKVPWPSDRTVAMKPESGVIPSLPVVGATKILFSATGIKEIRHPNPPVQITNGIPLYSIDMSVRVCELNLKLMVPDAERLFFERHALRSMLGKPYTWKHFYDDIANLHNPAHMHQDMLEWWIELYRDAEASEVLSSEPSGTLFRRRTPARIRKALHIHISPPRHAATSYPSKEVATQKNGNGLVLDQTPVVTIWPDVSAPLEKGPERLVDVDLPTYRHLETPKAKITPWEMSQLMPPLPSQFN